MSTLRLKWLFISRIGTFGTLYRWERGKLVTFTNFALRGEQFYGFSACLFKIACESVCPLLPLHIITKKEGRRNINLPPTTNGSVTRDIACWGREAEPCCTYFYISYSLNSLSSCRAALTTAEEHIVHLPLQGNKEELRWKRSCCKLTVFPRKHQELSLLLPTCHLWNLSYKPRNLKIDFFWTLEGRSYFLKKKYQKKSVLTRWGGFSVGRRQEKCFEETGASIESGVENWMCASGKSPSLESWGSRTEFLELWQLERATNFHSPCSLHVGHWCSGNTKWFWVAQRACVSCLYSHPISDSREQVRLPPISITPITTIIYEA